MTAIAIAVLAISGLLAATYAFEIRPVLDERKIRREMGVRHTRRASV